MSLRDINWRKGLLRLWLLFTVPWVLFFGYLTFNDSRTYIDRINIEKKLRSLKQNMETEKTLLPHKHGIYINLIDIISDRLFLDLSNNDQKILLKEISNDFVNLSDEEKDHFLYALKTKDFSVDKGDFVFFLYLTFIPPLLILGIGTTTYWAFRGFLTKQ